MKPETDRCPSAADLTRDCPWDFRVVQEGRAPGPWTRNLSEAAAGLLPPAVPLSWPRVWKAYGPFPLNFPLRAEACPPAFLSPGPLPPEILVCGAPRAGTDLEPDSRGYLDFARCFGGEAHAVSAYTAAEFVLESDAVFTLHAGGDWWMEWWLDGEPFGDTLSTGNRTLPFVRAHPFTRPLRAGTHRLAVRVIGGSQGWGLVCEGQAHAGETPAPAGLRLEARRVFSVEEPRRHVSYTLVGSGPRPARVNGLALPPDIPGVRVLDRDGIPPDFLRKGENRLDRVWVGEEALRGLRAGGLRFFQASGDCAKLTLERAVLGLPPEAVALGTGPVLGWADTRTVTLSCRANARVPLHLRLGGRIQRSDPALIHRFAVADLEPGRAWPYTVETAEGRVLGEGTARTLPIDRPVTLGILGDPSPSPERFELIAARLHALKPDVLLLLGDLTRDGRMAPLWDGDLFHRAPDLFRNTPTLAIQGNHEMDSPYLEHILVTPSGTRNWVQRIATLTLIGIDGAGDWSPGSANHAWLDKALETRETPFVVVANHYPAFSSSGHGVENGEGIPREPVVRSSRFHILPLLARHRVQAYFNGHEHGYERSLLPGGVTALICAGGGGRLYPLSPDPAQNPHRLVNQPVHHIGLLTLTPGEMIFEARGLNGFCLDRVLWRVT